jgi:hypothetical protein
MIRLPIALITAFLVTMSYSVTPNQGAANQLRLPIVIAPVAVCTPTPLEVTAVGTRLRRSELPSQYDALQESEPQWQIDGVQLSSHAATEFSGDFRHGPAWIWDEIIVYCSAEIAVDAWPGVVDAVKGESPTREEHSLEIGQQTFAFSQVDQGHLEFSNVYGLLFRQGNVVVRIYITGYEDVIDLETIEDLGDIIEAKLE